MTACDDRSATADAKPAEAKPEAAKPAEDKPVEANAESGGADANARAMATFAEVDAERRYATEWEGEGPAYRAEIDLLMFHKGDKAGFYSRSQFEHGDDYTDFCVPTGTPQAPVANVTADQAKALAGAFATARAVL